MVYNLIIQVDSFCDSRDKVRVERFISNILECVDLLGYEEIINEEISIFVEKRPEA